LASFIKEILPPHLFRGFIMTTSLYKNKVNAEPTHEGEICPYEPAGDIGNIVALELQRAPDGTVSYLVKPNPEKKEKTARAMVFWNKGTSSWQMNVTGNYVEGSNPEELPFAHVGYEINQSARELTKKAYPKKESELEEIARKSLEKK
jgi:hypothetical protein